MDGWMDEGKTQESIKSDVKHHDDGPSRPHTRSHLLYTLPAPIFLSTGNFHFPEVLTFRRCLINHWRRSKSIDGEKPGSVGAAVRQDNSNRGELRVAAALIVSP